VTAAEQRPQGLPRSFQRVVSGPVLSSITTGTATVRGSNRKMGTRVLPAAASAQRVTIEQYREMDDKVRLENEEMRLTVREEEKENITDVVPDGQGVVLHPTTTQAHPQPKHHRPSGLSPRLLQPRSASISGLPSRASSASLSSIPNNVSSTGRQILPGPNRAGRILVGAKYTTTTSTSAQASASAVGITGSGLGFDRISEVETSDDGVGAGTGASGLAGVLDFYAAEDGTSPLPFSFCIVLFYVNLIAHLQMISPHHPYRLPYHHHHPRPHLLLHPPYLILIMLQRSIGATLGYLDRRLGDLRATSREIRVLGGLLV
jgi:hypothetical protein